MDSPTTVDEEPF
ncbi:Protein of unknown function [Lactobacillus helveticus CIRM-BIA 101]|nr:Protein of unknown function [Lactobacillus helveticus CIRM-BIA 101]